MSALLHIALLAVVQSAPIDTIPLPRLDSAWTVLESVTLRGESLPDAVPVWLRIDEWGRAREARTDSSVPLPDGAPETLERMAEELRFVPPRPGPGWARIVIPVKAKPPVEETSGETRKPELENAYAMQYKWLRDYYPLQLKRAGVGGTVTVWVFIDTGGRPRNVIVRQSSGNRELDEAAERAGWRGIFKPALNKGKPVPVWVAVPFIFGGESARRMLEPRKPSKFTFGPRSHPVAEALVQSPVDEFPELVRPDLAEGWLTRVYAQSGPDRDVGLFVLFEVDADGRIRDVSVWDRRPEGSADSEFERRFLRVLKRMRFRPALASQMPVASAFTAWFIFSRRLGPIPSAAAECDPEPNLPDEPEPAEVDTPPVVATPDWEWARIVKATWPLVFQKKGKRYEFDFWLLLDEGGRVCEARFADDRPGERYMAAKARALAKRLRFVPAERDGAPVAVWHRYRMEFSF
jgi:TonB family protein